MRISEQVRALLESGESCSIIFTSPSTANVFHRSIGVHTGYERFTICTIGHITKNYLESLGATVQVMPETYTLLEVVNKLANWKGRDAMTELVFQRHRRLRKTAGIRSMVKETYLHKEDLIYPIFVMEGENIKNPVASMPGVFQFSLDRLGEEIDEVVSLRYSFRYFIWNSSRKRCSWNTSIS